MKRDIVIGDVHGCLDELDELLRVVGYFSGRDRLVFVGDLVDRGPDSIGVVRRVDSLVAHGAMCVMGNHDEWYVRYAKYERAGGKNPMSRPAHKVALYEQMDAVDLDFLSALPLWCRLDARTVVVHAGMAPGLPVGEQDPRHLLRMRYLERATGKMAKLDDLMTPATHAYWSEIWTGPDEVVYGHHPSKSETVLTENAGVRCWGIDTGCCFGNKLTAWVRTGERIELVSVPAREQYADWHKSMGD